MKLHAGHLSIDDMASSYGLNRQQFARKVHAAAGLGLHLAIDPAAGLWR
jgi:hypothetical protein